MGAWIKARYSEAGAEIVTGLQGAVWGAYVLWIGPEKFSVLPTYELYGWIWGLKHWAIKFLILGLVQAIPGPASGRRWVRGAIAFVMAWCAGVAASAFIHAPVNNTVGVIFAGISVFNTATVLYFIGMWLTRRTGPQVGCR